MLITPILHQYHLSELGESQNEHQRFSCHRFNMIMIAIVDLQAKLIHCLHRILIRFTQPLWA